MVCDAATGEVLRTGRATHPDSTEVDPRHWWSAYESATAGGMLDDVSEPSSLDRARTCVLPHDWLTGQILRAAGVFDGWVTDGGDASGTGYWSAAARTYRPDLLRLAAGRDLEVPRVASPAEVVLGLVQAVDAVRAQGCPLSRVLLIDVMVDPTDNPAASEAVQRYRMTVAAEHPSTAG
ncbi:MAG: hypothetical protein ACRCXL_11955 [Dermatophilaceae bacterium]